MAEVRAAIRIDADPESTPFWEGCRRHELLVQRCNSCQRFYFYPRGVCPHCWSSDVEWTRSAGRGRVYSYSIVRRATPPVGPAFAAKIPYVVAIVELEDTETRLLTNIVGCDPDSVAIGMPVAVAFQEVGTDAVIPVFEPMG